MAERASIFELPRIGVETTPGTPVAANLVLRSLTVTPTPVIPRNPIRASGNMAAVGFTGGKQHTEFGVEGPLTYTDSAFLFNSILGAPTSTTASGQTTITWRPLPQGINTLRTYTFEMGSAAGTAGFSGAFLTDLGISITREGATISGSGLGKIYQEGITLTPNPADVVLEPVSPEQVSVFAAASRLGLDQTGARLKRCLSANLNLAGRQSALFTLDDSEQSFSASVERYFDKTAQIVVEQDSQGSALMGSLKSNEVVWIRYVAIGREIGTGVNYEMRITFPAFIKSTSRGDTDDIYAGTYDLEPVYVDDAFGSGLDGYLEVVLKTKAATATQASTVGSAPSSGNGVQLFENVTTKYAELADTTP
jgi:hypothetical protein